MVIGDSTADETCEKDGIEYGDLDEVPSGDTCNKCYCDLGQIICSADICEPEETKNCTYGGAIYKNLDRFPDSCNTCTCNDGQVTCTKKGCNGVDPDSIEAIIDRLDSTLLAGNIYIIVVLTTIPIPVDWWKRKIISYHCIIN